jgi:ribosome-associated protein
MISVHLRGSPRVQEEDRPSKTQRKRAMHELQALGARLVELNPEQLDSIGLPENLRRAVDDAQRFSKHEAKRRQMQYIGRLMRAVDPEPIREKLKTWDGVHAAHAARVHMIERWRDRLIGEDGALAELAREQVGIDTQRLRALVRNAREERDTGRAPPRAYRQLFRALRDMIAEAQPDAEHEHE